MSDSSFQGCPSRLRIGNPQKSKNRRSQSDWPFNGAQSRRHPLYILTSFSTMSGRDRMGELRVSFPESVHSQSQSPSYGNNNYRSNGQDLEMGQMSQGRIPSRSASALSVQTAVAGLDEFNHEVCP